MNDLGQKSSDDSRLIGHPAREVNHPGLDLRKVYDYPSAMAVLVDALKNKGVRFDELSFKNGDITYLKENIVILRGAAYKLIDRSLKGSPCCFPGEKPALDLGVDSVPILAGDASKEQGLL